MSWALFAVAGILTVSLCSYIYMIGRPREPITPGLALLNCLSVVPMIVVVVVAALRMR